ncbi:MAG TPA: hypothetical protein VGM92_09695 [Candidatus Kapabacteria bacterium]
MSEVHEIHYVDDVRVIGDHLLLLKFEDGCSKTVDLSGSGIKLVNVLRSMFRKV